LLMAEMTITVPGSLAEDLRRYHIAADDVCQRALLDSVASRRPLSAGPREASEPVLTHRTRAVVKHARQLSAAPNSVDLLRGLAAEGDFAREVLRVISLDIDELAREVADSLRRPTHHLDSLDQVLDRAIASAMRLGHRHVGSEHLLLALAGDACGESVALTLRDHGVDPVTMEPAVVFMLAGFAFARSSGGLVRGLA
jgi:hypothetical protein